MCCNEKHSPPLPRGKKPPTCTKQIKPLSSERLLPVLCSILVIHLLKILLTKAEQKQLNLQRAELCSPLQKPYTDLPQIPLRKHSKGCFSNWGAGISFFREKSHYLVIREEKSLSPQDTENVLKLINCSTWCILKLDFLFQRTCMQSCSLMQIETVINTSKTRL